MFKSIRLKNYKCFNNLDLEIAPLTILCGTNSSGKSSIINSFLMLKQSYESNITENSMSFNGEYIKCGSYEDISTDRNGAPIAFKVRYALQKPRKPRGNRVSKTDITAFKTLAKLFPNPKEISSFDVESVVVLKRDQSTNRIKDNIVDEYRITLTVFRNSHSSLDVKINLKHSQDKQYVITIDNIPNGAGEIIQKQVVLKSCVCYFENFTPINAFATSVSPADMKIEDILANLYLIFRMNATQFRNIKYLTPLRVYPQRNYILDNEANNVGLSGEFTPHIMYKYADQNVNGFLPPQEKICIGKEKYQSFSYFVNEWMDYLGLGKYTLDNAFEMIKVNVSDFNISNVGFGVSQVLPILVSGLIEQKSELLLLEQPEIHLHPSAQMGIADFLLSMAAVQRGLIIETHSDHIINRVVKRILQDKTGTLNQLVKIYFVDGTNREEPITQIIVDPQKGITNAPQQFFTQFGSESMLIAKCAMENYREGIQW